MKRFAASLFVVLFVSASSNFASSTCRDVEVVRWKNPFQLLQVKSANAQMPDAILQYFGHNFFQVISSKGTKILTDPLAPGLYPVPFVEPHVITVGREHPNHNAVEIARGRPVILRGLTNFGVDWNNVSTSVRDVFIYNVPVYQNGVEGALKGAAFVFDLGNLCIAHLGDLSHPLSREQIKQIGKVDVTLIPIGGTFTMGPDIARQVLNQLKPKIAIPMHYRDNRATLEAFITGFPSKFLKGDTLTVSKSALPPTFEIIILRQQGSHLD
jgi:L-ascorbate metabolism protein UlaG (beta-lactamase superfamily)